MENGAERRPPTGIQAQHPAPAPHASHARHDRSMARNRLAARVKVGGLGFSPSVSRKSAPRQWRGNGEHGHSFSHRYSAKWTIPGEHGENMESQSSSPLIKIRVS